MSAGRRSTRTAKGSSPTTTPTVSPRSGEGSENRPHIALRSLLYVLGVFALSLFVFGSVFFPAPHSGGDNAGYLSLAFSLVEGMGYRELWDPATPLHTKYPPVFSLLLGGLILAGASTWTAFKLFVLLCTAGAVVFVFAWASARRGPIAGLSIALLTLLSAGWLDASRWILSEPVFLFLTFLALWAMERGAVGTVQGARPGIESSARESSPPTSVGSVGRWAKGDGWFLLAGAAALLAYLTRSAGLPLVLALLGALLLRRAYRAGIFLASLFALFSGWWFLRARSGEGDGAYQSEFWMVNPYEPELGVIGWTDLPVRVSENLRIYLAEVLPAQWLGTGGGPTSLLFGLLLVGIAFWGFFLRFRARSTGGAELFLLLYAGIILLWPSVWSGERFLIPLVPILLLLAGEGLWGVGAKLGRGRPALLALGFLLLALPALPGWMAMATEGGECRRRASGGDPFLCHNAGFQEFRAAAIWSGANLPDSAVVLNRKPRIFSLLNGPQGVVFPFTTDPDHLLAEADRVGAQYLLFDHLDGISPFYLPPLIEARVSAFCHIGGWGGRGEGVLRTELFGILSPAEREEGGEMSDLQPCPPGYLESSGEVEELSGNEIPLLHR